VNNFETYEEFVTLEAAALEFALRAHQLNIDIPGGLETLLGDARKIREFLAEGEDE
jgi:hypothetical protein